MMEYFGDPLAAIIVLSVLFILGVLLTRWIFSIGTIVQEMKNQTDNLRQIKEILSKRNP